MKELELFKEYMLNHGKSKLTVSNTVRDAEEFLSIMQIDSINQLIALTALDVEKYLSSIREKGNTDNTRKTKVARVRSFFNFLSENEIIQKNVMRNQKVKCGVPEIVEYSHKDLLKMLKYAKNTREYAILHTFMGTGLRVSELINLKCDKVFSDGRIQVLGKGNKWRTVQPAKRVVNVLLKYIEETKDVRGKSKYVFINKDGSKMTRDFVAKDLKRLAKRCEIPAWEQFSPHKLRHEYAMYSLNVLGTPIDVVSKNLGHADVSVTSRIYAKTNQNRAREYADQIDEREMFGINYSMDEDEDE